MDSNEEKESESDFLADLMDIFNSKTKTTTINPSNEPDMTATDQSVTRSFDSLGDRRSSWQSDASAESPSTSRKERGHSSRDNSQDDLLSCLPTGERLEDDEEEDMDISDQQSRKKGLDSGFHPSSSSEKLDSESVDTLDLDSKSFDEGDGIILREPGHERKDRERTVSSQSFTSFTSLSEDDLDFSAIQKTENLNVGVIKHKCKVVKTGSMALRRKPTRAARHAGISKNTLYEMPSASLQQSFVETSVDDVSSSPRIQCRAVSESPTSSSPRSVRRKTPPGSPQLQHILKKPSSPKLRPVTEEASRTARPTPPVPVKTKPAGGIKIPLGLPGLPGSPPKLRSVRKSTEPKPETSPSVPAWRSEIRLKKSEDNNVIVSNADTTPPWLRRSPNKIVAETTAELEIPAAETIKIEESPTMEFKEAAPPAEIAVKTPSKEIASPSRKSTPTASADGKTDKEKSYSPSWFDKYILRKKPTPSPKPPKPDKKADRKGSASSGADSDNNNSNKSPKKSESKKSERSASVSGSPKQTEPKPRKSSLFGFLDDDKDDSSTPPWMREIRVRKNSRTSVSSGSGGVGGGSNGAAKDEAQSYKKSDKDKPDKPSWMKEMMARRRKTQEKLNVKDIMLAKEIISTSSDTDSTDGAKEIPVATLTQEPRRLQPRSVCPEPSNKSIESANNTNNFKTHGDHDIVIRDKTPAKYLRLDHRTSATTSSSTDGQKSDDYKTHVKIETGPSMQYVKKTVPVPSPRSSQSTTAEKDTPIHESSVPAWKAEIAARRKAKGQGSPPKSDASEELSNIPPWKLELAAKSKNRSASNPMTPKEATSDIPPWKLEIAQRRRRTQAPPADNDDEEVDWKKELENMKKKPVSLSSSYNESQC
ncbi:uncharacterized protein LOC141898330 [Tubulanus polymorphus]|uniref:uncharacterized protein LOC141898330 n=1 Tax=Tubulanus polymorphus TaxID=672921 RepID=UPI003DA652BA